jgi:hypothetical protein
LPMQINPDLKVRSTKGANYELRNDKCQYDQA